MYWHLDQTHFAGVEVIGFRFQLGCILLHKNKDRLLNMLGIVCLS